MELNIKAKYKPKTHDNISSKMIVAATETVYDWEFAFIVNRQVYYSSNDILFPSTMPVCIDNLEIMKEKGEN